MQPLPPKPAEPKPDVTITPQLDNRGGPVSTTEDSSVSMGVGAPQEYDFDSQMQPINDTLNAYRKAVFTGDMSDLDFDQLSRIKNTVGFDATAPGSALYNKLLSKFREEYDKTPEAMRGKTRSASLEHFSKLATDTFGMNRIARKAQMMSNMPNLTEADIDNLLNEMETHEKGAETPWAMGFIGDAVSRIAPLPGLDAWRLGSEGYVNRQMK